jgi:hypothetical protein
MEEAQDVLRNLPKEMEYTKKVRRTFKSFLEQTSAHGFSNVVRSNSIITRTVWLIILVLAMICAIDSVKSVLTAYLNCEFLTVTKSINDIKSLFPAVTVCNMNPYRKSVLKKRWDSSGWYQIDPWKTQEADKNLLLNMALGKWLSWKKPAPEIGKFVEAFIPLVYFLNASLAASAGHQEKNLIWKCHLDGSDCKEHVFFNQTYNPTYGNCYTFNIDSSKEIKVDSIIMRRI